MGDSYLSPGDPLFWLHHNNLERLFVSWQKKDLKRRLKDVSGPIYAFDFANQRGGNVTLGFEVNLGPLGGSRSLGSLMEVGKKELCYEF